MQQTIASTDRVKTTVAQQFFSVGSGVCAGVAGFILANQLSGARDVKASKLLLATAISGLFSFMAAVWLGHSTQGE